MEDFNELRSGFEIAYIPFMGVRAIRHFSVLFWWWCTFCRSIVPCVIYIF